jgi:serine/threonine protein kinase
MLNPATPPRPTSAPAATPVAAPRETADAARRPQRSLAEGDVLRGRYRVQGLLGQGGMGTVFAAIDQYRLERTNGDNRVAIKVLHTEVIKRPRLFAELRREFQHLQSLSHPNIVRVHEFDRDGDLAFFTMEYLNGTLLRRVLSAQESSTLYRPHALAIVRDVGAAVAHAHARGVVHGDLNPGNIFITDNGEVRVVDFGASHQLHRGPWISEFDNQQQIAVATLRYASCQLLEGEAADARDDVYALACITYVLLTGDHPFQEHTALKARTLRLTPSRPSGLSRRQWNALRAGLDFDREQRPADMQAWLDRLDLRAAAASLPALPSLMTVRVRRRSDMRRWAAVAAVTALIVACGWAVTANVDAMARAGAAVSAQFKSILASTVTSQWWDKSLGGRGKAEPVIEAPASPAPTDAAPEPRADRAASQTKPTSATPNSDSSTTAESRSRTGAAAPPVSAGPAPPPRASAAAPPAAAAAPPKAAPPSAAALTAGNAPSAAGPPAPPPKAAAPATAAPLPAAAPLTAGTSPTAAGPSKAAPPAAAAGQTGYPLRARIELVADNVEVSPTEGTARVMVHRSRLLRGDASFSWWTESGTAKPGRDFVGVKSQVEHIENGKDAASLVIPIVVDPSRRQSRSFYVVIDQSSDTAAVGPRTLTMVTISGSG